jgi:hypothetical protein
MDTSAATTTEMDDLEYAELMTEIEDGRREREAAWMEMRNEILARGGITTGDVTRHRLPGQVYRVNGLPVDVIARDMADEGFGTWETGEEFLDEMWVLFEAYQGEWGRLCRSGKARWGRAA